MSFKFEEVKLSYTHCATGGWGQKNAIDKAGKLNINEGIRCEFCRTQFGQPETLPAIYHYRKNVAHPSEGFHICKKCWSARGSGFALFMDMLQKNDVIMASEIIK